MDQKLYNSYIKILKNELVPALGCTEPIAIAYAAAKAHEVLGQMPEKIELCCSGNIIKNVKGVKVPNSNGLKGIDVAATLGVVGGRADRELEVLEDVTEADIEKTKELVQQGFCTCTLKEGVENLYIVAKVIAGEHSAEVTIVNRHTLISRIVKDGEVLYQIAAHEDSPEYVDKSVLNVKDILEFADTVRIEDVKDILDRQITMNSAISMFSSLSSAIRMCMPVRSWISSLASACCGALTSISNGIHTTKVVPIFLWVSNSMVPPISSTSFFVIARPRPVPSMRVRPAASSCANGS